VQGYRFQRLRVIVVEVRGSLLHTPQRRNLERVHVIKRPKFLAHTRNERAPGIGSREFGFRVVRIGEDKCYRGIPSCVEFGHQHALETRAGRYRQNLRQLCVRLIEHWPTVAAGTQSILPGRIGRNVLKEAPSSSFRRRATNRQLRRSGTMREVLELDRAEEPVRQLKPGDERQLFNRWSDRGLRVIVNGSGCLAWQIRLTAVEHQHRVERGCVQRRWYTALENHELGNGIVLQLYVWRQRDLHE